MQHFNTLSNLLYPCRKKRSPLSTFETWQGELVNVSEQLRTFYQLRIDQAELLKQLAGFPAGTQTETETRTQRLWRELVVRPVNLISGRESRLQERLNTLQIQRLDALEDALGHRLDLLETQLTLLEYRQRLCEMFVDNEYS